MVFYAPQLLSKHGPLGIIWMASHMERQLKRQQISDASITFSVDTIINSDAPLALRLSGQLLLGLVRIYARKLNYLYRDCSDTVGKIKASYNPSAHATVMEQNRLSRADSAARVEDLAPAAYDAFDLLEHEASQHLLTPSQGTLQVDLGQGAALQHEHAAQVFGYHAPADDEMFDGAEAALAFDLDDVEVEALRAEGQGQVRCTVLHCTAILGPLVLQQQLLSGRHEAYFMQVQCRAYPSTGLPVR